MQTCSRRILAMFFFLLNLLRSCFEQRTKIRTFDPLTRMSTCVGWFLVGKLYTKHPVRPYIQSLTIVEIDLEDGPRH